MAFSKKEKENKKTGPIGDPLGFDDEPIITRTVDQPTQPGEKVLRGELKRDKLQFGNKKKIVRIEQIKEAIESSGEDIDVEAVVSLYIPQRRAKLFGAALLRMSKLHLALLSCLLILAILFIMAFTQEKMGNFTINLNRLEMYRKGISIAETGDFHGATARLVADAVADATNISTSEVPNDLDQYEGSHNGENYMAYTYYVRNAGKEDVAYIARVNLDASAKGAEDAVRVAVWHNGEKTIYAEPSADGTPEPGCTNFQSRNVVCTFKNDEFLIGNVDKYTIAIWLEGDDPECIDDIVGGSVQFSMSIDADDDNDTTLFVKFVQDIIDSLTGNKPIFSSSDKDAPSYYQDREVTWDTRRNQ